MSNRFTAKVAESLKLRGWIDEIQAKALRADNARLESTLATYKAAVEKVRGALLFFQHEADYEDHNEELRCRQCAFEALHTLSALTDDATKTP